MNRNSLCDECVNFAEKSRVPLRWRLNKLAHLFGTAVNLQKILRQDLHFSSKTLC